MSIDEKNVTCELHVYRPTLRSNGEVVKLMEGNGNEIWFELISGYNLAMCREFYKRLTVVDEGLCILNANVKGKVFEITPDLIAMLMKY